jgi:general stress protein YciG
MNNVQYWDARMNIEAADDRARNAEVHDKVERDALVLKWHDYLIECDFSEAVIAAMPLESLRSLDRIKTQLEIRMDDFFGRMREFAGDPRDGADIGRKGGEVPCEPPSDADRDSSQAEARFRGIGGPDLHEHDGDSEIEPDPELGGMCSGYD